MSTNQLHPPPQERQQDQLSAQAQYAPLPPPSQAGFSLQHLFARWQAVLLEPSLAKFDAQRREANWQTVWFSLLGLAIVQAAVAIFQQAEAFYHPRARGPLPSGIGVKRSRPCYHRTSVLDLVRAHGRWTRVW
jgi:hypothetical protein